MLIETSFFNIKYQKRKQHSDGNRNNRKNYSSFTCHLNAYVILIFGSD